MKTRSIVPMRIAKIGYIIASIAFCIVGVLLILYPDFSIALFGDICSILLICFGAIRLIGYFSKDLYRLAFQYDLAFGIILIALGFAILIHPESMMLLICFALGLFILADSLFKIRIAFDSKNFGIREWWLILSTAVFTGILGFILIFYPNQGSRILMLILGFSFLLEGILNFITVITAVKIITYQKPDVN